MLPTSILAIDSLPKTVSTQYVGKEFSSWQTDANQLFANYTTRAFTIITDTKTEKCQKEIFLSLPEKNHNNI